jgi:8-oxo-dGTP pyrophosphatase MutT (NUDIX family)
MVRRTSCGFSTRRPAAILIRVDGEANVDVIDRLAARVVLLDADGRVLLFRGSDPARPQDGTWWITPGGGVEPGESLEQAARRELREETGFALTEPLGPIVFSRIARFSFEGREYEQTEHFFRAELNSTGLNSTEPNGTEPNSTEAAGTEVDYSGWTEIERRSIQTHRWWTASELRATAETVYPETLADLLVQDDVEADGSGPAGGAGSSNFNRSASTSSVPKP